MENKKLTMSLMKEKFAVCRMSPAEAVPAWGQKSDFFSITKTIDELSGVCYERDVPEGVQCEKDWKVLKIEGPLDFSLVGILASISTVLAQNEVSIFAISTYDTDYMLVRDKDLQKAVEALEEDGYEIII